MIIFLYMKKISPVLFSFIFLIFLISQGALAQSADQVDEFVVALTPSKLVLDPLHSYKTQELQIATAIYEGLVSYHPVSLKPVPGVAWRWEISDDGLSYRFHLRKNAQYSNGDQVTAQHFRDSWLRILKPGTQGEYSFLFDVIKGAAEYRSGKSADTETVGIIAVDKSTLVVELLKPASHFLSILCHMSFMPVHPQYFERTNWDRETPLVGNGPFFLFQRAEDEIILEKNAYYWDQRNVHMDRFRILFIDDLKEITEGLNQGSIHWAGNSDVGSLIDRELIQFYPLFGTSYLYFLADVTPWSDPRVRRGLVLLLPWDNIREQSSAFGTERLVPALQFYPEVEGIRERDAEEGLSLLKEAGFAEGNGLPEILIRVPRGSAAEIAAMRMEELWEETLAVQVTVITQTYNTYLSELRKNDYAIAAATWIGDFADPLTFLQLWTSESNLNDARYSNPGFDSLIEKSLEESDETRFGTLAEAETMLLREAVVLPLSHPPAFNVIDLRKIDGWYPNPLDIHPLKHLRFKRMLAPPNVAIS